MFNRVVHHVVHHIIPQNHGHPSAVFRFRNHIFYFYELGHWKEKFIQHWLHFYNEFYNNIYQLYTPSLGKYMHIYLKL